MEKEERPVLKSSKTSKTVTTEIEQPVEVVETKKDNFKSKAAEAAANVALKAAIETSSVITQHEAEKAYNIEKRKFMLDKCKNDRVVPFTGEKILAPYFGKVYTFTYNCIPVTIFFDGVERYYPAFIVDKIKEKISRVSEANTYKEEIEKF